MKRFILSSLAVMVLFAFGIASTAATAGETQKAPRAATTDIPDISMTKTPDLPLGLDTVLKDTQGNTLANYKCNVSHKDGSESPTLRVGENGNVSIPANESGVLICQHGVKFYAARLVEHKGGEVVMIPFELKIGLRDLYRESIRGLPQMDVVTEGIGVGLGGPYF